MATERRWRVVALLALGIVIGIALTASPATSHVANWTHNWNKHIKPRADNRYVNTKEFLWAVVETDGTLVRGSRVVSAANFAGSQYEVIFNRDVTGCAFIAVIGSPGSAVFPAPGGAEVAGRSGKPNGVAIQTFNSAGAPAQRPFHLQVLC